MSKKKETEEMEKGLYESFKHIFGVGVEEILERKVVAVGNGAHINIPLKHLGKSARIFIKKQEEDNTKD